MYVKRKQVRKLVRKKVALHVVKERKLMHAVQHNINSNMDSTVWTKYIQSRYTSLHGDICWGFSESGCFALVATGDPRLVK